MLHPMVNVTELELREVGDVAFGERAETYGFDGSNPPATSFRLERMRDSYFPNCSKVETDGRSLKYVPRSVEFLAVKFNWPSGLTAKRCTENWPCLKGFVFRDGVKTKPEYQEVFKLYNQLWPKLSPQMADMWDEETNHPSCKTIARGLRYIHQRNETSAVVAAVLFKRWRVSDLFRMFYGYLRTV
jgi:hypothetical protein